jgi:hypothetical protein
VDKGLAARVEVENVASAKSVASRGIEKRETKIKRAAGLLTEEL